MSTQVTIRFDITTETLQKAFPTATAVKLNQSGKTATIEFPNAVEAKAATESSSFVCPFSARPDVVFCKPDVTTVAPDATKLATYTDNQTETGARIYKNTTDLKTQHISSLKFTPVMNSVILTPLQFGLVEIQVISIAVVPRAQGRLSVYIQVYHKASGRRGVLIFKRAMDNQGEEVLTRRCFDLLVDKDDYKKGPADIVPVHYISIESITVDPEGYWSELKISLDEVQTPLSLFRLGAVRAPQQRRSSISQTPNQERRSNPPHRNNNNNTKNNNIGTTHRQLSQQLNQHRNNNQTRTNTQPRHTTRRPQAPVVKTE